MRIGFVCHSGSTGLGGAERCTLEVIAALQSKGVECFCVSPAAGAFHQELLRRGVPAEIIPYTWWASDQSSLWSRFKRLARNAVMTFRVARWLRARGCEVVYTSTAVICVGAFAAKLLGLRHVWHIYEFGLEDHELVFDLGRAAALRLMDRLSDVCVAVSQAIVDHYCDGIRPEKLKLVYFAVQEPKDARPAADAFTASGLKCAMAGRIDKTKGTDDAIRAVAELYRAGVDAQLVIAGRGPEEEPMKNLCRELGLERRVKFLGLIPDAFAVLKAADVVLTCSRKDALGRVAVEAMYASRPVIGTRSGGTPELIREGFNGYLYEPGDPKDLARRLRTFIDKPGLAAELGANGRRWALERFSEKRLGEDLWAILGPWERHAL